VRRNAHTDVHSPPPPAKPHKDHANATVFPAATFLSLDPRPEEEFRRLHKENHHLQKMELDVDDIWLDSWLRRYPSQFQATAPWGGDGHSKIGRLVFKVSSCDCLKALANTGLKADLFRQELSARYLFHQQYLSPTSTTSTTFTS
jgi:hypothetical protein